MEADRARRWVPLAIVGGLLAAAAVAATVATPGVRRLPIRTQSTPPPSPSGSGGTLASRPVPGSLSSAPEHTSSLPSWFDTVAGVLCALLVAVLLGLLLWRGVRYFIQVRAEQVAAADRGLTPEPTRREAVLAAVDAGLAELADEQGDARSAVIICWVRLEQVAAVAGTPRGTGDTPTDLVSRLLAAHQVSGPVLDELAGLYRAARYGTGPVDTGMRARARAALAHLRTELARSRSGTLAEDDVVDAGPRAAWPEGGR